MQAIITSVKEGVVAVRGHFMWRERYVFLYPGQLIIRRSKRGAIKAKIDLFDPTVSIIFHEDQSILTIASHGHDTVLNCHSSASRDEWLSALFSAKSHDETDCESTSDVVASVLLDHEHLIEHQACHDEEYDDSDENENNAINTDALRSTMLAMTAGMASESSECDVEPLVLRRASSSEEELKLKCLQSIVSYIQTTEQGGKTILLHLSILQPLGITLEDILTALGDKQLEKARRASLSDKNATGLQRLNVSMFVRYLLFHPIYSTRSEAQTEVVNHLIDRYFPHCRLRRFTHDGDPNRVGPGSFEMELSLASSLHNDINQIKRLAGSQPTAAPVTPIIVPLTETFMKRKRHSFPNILLPLAPLAPSSSVDVSSTSINTSWSTRRTSSDQPMRPSDSANKDSDLFQDHSLLDPLRSLLWRSSCLEIAEQLSIFHHTLFHSLCLWEFITQPKPLGKEITDHFNRLVSYLVWSVLVEATPKDRAEVIESIISIATIASSPELYNFHLVMACVGCLGDSPLMKSRLPLTWKKVRNKFKTQLAELRTLCNHSGGFDVLRKRQAVESMKGSCVPFIGVIGVALERLRMTPYYHSGRLDLDRMDRQYRAIAPLENCILKRYDRLHPIDALQTFFQSLNVEFATHRLLDLRSQHLMETETNQRTDSRTSSLHRSLTTGAVTDIPVTSDDGAPILPFRNVCSILISTPLVSDRIEIAIEALIADERHAGGRFVRKFWNDFKQNICTSACHVGVQGIRQCIDTLHHDVIAQKSIELLQLTDVDTWTNDMSAMVYIAIVQTVTMPIAKWMWNKIKYTFATEDKLMIMYLQQWHATIDQSSKCVEQSALDALCLTLSRVSTPVEVLYVIRDVLNHLPQDQTVRIPAILQTFQRQSESATHIFSLLSLVEIMDIKLLPQTLHDAYESLAGAVAVLYKSSESNRRSSSLQLLRQTSIIRESSRKANLIQPVELVRA